MRIALTTTILLILSQSKFPAIYTTSVSPSLPFWTSLTRKTTTKKKLLAYKNANWSLPKDQQKPKRCSFIKKCSKLIHYQHEWVVASNVREVNRGWNHKISERCEVWKHEVIKTIQNAFLKVDLFK